jgi:hypothetical protein
MVAVVVVEEEPEEEQKMRKREACSYGKFSTHCLTAKRSVVYVCV